MHDLPPWKLWELPLFVLLGGVGGLFGTFLVKAARFQLTLTKRKDLHHLPLPLRFQAPLRFLSQLGVLTRHPLLQVTLATLLTNVLSWGNPYTRASPAFALAKVAAPCHYQHHSNTSSPFSNNLPRAANPTCPLPSSSAAQTDHVFTLLLALLIKTLTTLLPLALSLPVPAGIYVPSMVLGALLGAVWAHTLQIFLLKFSSRAIMNTTASSAVASSMTVPPAAYAVAGAGAVACGVARAPVTLAVALVEIASAGQQSGRGGDFLVPLTLAVGTAWGIAEWAAGEGGGWYVCILATGFLSPLPLPFLCVGGNSAFYDDHSSSSANVLALTIL